jgi:hypothetical protein
MTSSKRPRARSLAVILARAIAAVGLGRIEPLTWSVARLWMPVNAIFVAMLATNFYALKTVVPGARGRERLGHCPPARTAGEALSRAKRPPTGAAQPRARRNQHTPQGVGMVSILKNITNLFIIAGDWFWFRRCVVAAPRAVRAPPCTACPVPEPHALPCAPPCKALPC